MDVVRTGMSKIPT